MKLKLILIFVIITSIFLCGCADKQNPNRQIIMNGNYNILYSDAVDEWQIIEIQQNALLYNEKNLVYPFYFSNYKLEKFIGNQHNRFGDIYRFKFKTPINLTVIKDYQLIEGVTLRLINNIWYVDIKLK